MKAMIFFMKYRVSAHEARFFHDSGKNKRGHFGKKCPLFIFSTSDSGNILNQFQRILDLIQAGNVLLPDCNIK